MTSPHQPRPSDTNEYYPDVYHVGGGSRFGQDLVGVDLKRLLLGNRDPFRGAFEAFQKRVADTIGGIAAAIAAAFGGSREQVDPAYINIYDAILPTVEAARAANEAQQGVSDRFQQIESQLGTAGQQSQRALDQAGKSLTTATEASKHLLTALSDRTVKNLLSNLRIMAAKGTDVRLRQISSKAQDAETLPATPDTDTDKASNAALYLTRLIAELGLANTEAILDNYELDRRQQEEIKILAQLARAQADFNHNQVIINEILTLTDQQMAYTQPRVLRLFDGSYQQFSTEWIEGTVTFNRTVEMRGKGDVKGKLLWEVMSAGIAGEYSQSHTYWSQNKFSSSWSWLHTHLRHITYIQITLYPEPSKRIADRIAALKKQLRTPSPADVSALEALPRVMS